MIKQVKALIDLAGK